MDFTVTERRVDVGGQRHFFRFSLETATAVVTSKNVQWCKGLEVQAALSLTLHNFFLSPQNEMDDVPFFDVHLPYELAINIFQYLNRRELGLCAQVSSL